MSIKIKTFGTKNENPKTYNIGQKCKNYWRFKSFSGDAIFSKYNWNN